MPKRLEQRISVILVDEMNVSAKVWINGVKCDVEKTINELAVQAERNRG